MIRGLFVRKIKKRGGSFMDILVLFNALPGACAQGLIWGIMAIGVYITYKILDLADLTVDGTMCTGGAVCIMMMTTGHSVGVSLAAAFFAGLLAGLVTGVLHTTFGIPAILAGILTQLGLYSINLRIMGGKANQAISVDKYKLLVSLRYVKGVALTQNTLFVVAIIIVILIGILYWFFGTELGSSIRATGCNENMSRAQGINTDFCKILGLMLSNGIVAFASALYAQYQGFADVNAGRGAIVIGLAAVIIGHVIFGKITENMAFRLLSVALGAIIYYLVLQIVLWLGLNSNDLKLLSAIVVAVFLAIPHLKEKHFTKPSKKGGASHA
jgi:putative ABC transport system permease protein